MNKDYTSDIKQVERFMFDNSIWMLNMFEKKIDSFISTKSKTVRMKEHENYMHEKNHIDPNKFFQDPIKVLAKDLTKPIWNCVVKMNPTIIVDRDFSFDSSIKTQSMHLFEISSQNRVKFSQLISTFANRYKIQHEDESNLKINILEPSRNEENSETKQILIQDFTPEEMERYTEKFINTLKQVYMNEKQFLESVGLQAIEEQFSCLFGQLGIFLEILELILENDHIEIKKQLNWFVNVSTQAIINILDAKAGPTALTIQPKISILNFIIHPMLLSINNALQVQFNYYDKERQKNLQAREKYINEKQKNGEMQEEKYQQKNQKNKQNQSEKSAIFKQLKFSNCSKFVFINLDGYQSDLNLQFAKYLSKYMMYISFPKQSYHRKQNEQLQKFQLFKSERLFEQFYSNESSQVLKQQAEESLRKMHELSDKQLRKNMFILPIHSKQLIKDHKQTFNIELYESNFVKFMMQQILLNHIRQFSPSIIIISYSGKIKIDTGYFVEFIKQLTIISSFRMMFYPNKAKMFCFEEFHNQFSNSNTKDQNIELGCELEHLENQFKYYEKYEKNKIDVFDTNDQLNKNNNSSQFDLSLLDELSIFLKVSSGTYNLQKKIEQDCHIQKFKNYKVMGYSAFLLKKLAKKYATIDKLKMRANQYQTIHKVLKNNYTNKTQTFDKMFDKTLTRYHQNLMKSLEKAIFFEHKALLQSNLSWVASCKGVIEKIKKCYDYIQMKQIWQDFKFQYSLELSTEKIENRFYLHIPKYKEKVALNQSKKKTMEDVVSVQFDIIIEKTKDKIPVELTSDSKIYYSKCRHDKDALIYVINHIPTIKQENYYSFYGILNQIFDQKSEGKISLKLVQFHSTTQKLQQFEHYIDFNFYQTEQFIFMFWPNVFNNLKEKLYRIYGQKYIPESSKLIFRASKSDPGNFYQMNVINESYQYVIPRNGCTCYEVPNTNKIYIFGGFYNDSDNYLKFQTDISAISFNGQNNQVIIQSLPKQFYFAIQKNSSTKKLSSQEKMQQENFEQNKKEIIQEGYSQINEIKLFKNDLIRPRIQYQVYVNQNKSENTPHQIFLIGGVGEKFLRPFSLITHMGHKVTFNEIGIITSIKRIKTNNLLPSNISNPVKSRNPQIMNRVKNAQNRNINLYEGMTNQESYVMSHYRYFYDKNQEKFEYQQMYEFADPDKKTQREETSYLKKTPVEYPVKYQLKASNFRGKQFNNNFITVISENGKKYIFQLQLQLSMQVKNAYPNYSKVVKLTGASIVAIDINASMLYCLVRHPSYTLDKCILAHFDISQLAGKLVDSKKLEINLKQIHKFDLDVSKNIIVVANSSTVAVLHGFRFQIQTQIPQMVLKKQRNNQIKTLAVKPCPTKSQILAKYPEQQTQRLINQISCSFFINQNNGNITGISFKSLHRNKNSQELVETVYVRIQRLNMTKSQYQWELKFQKIYKFSLCLNANTTNETIQMPTTQNKNDVILNNKGDYLRLLEIKPNKESKQTKQKQFFIKATYHEKIYEALLLIDKTQQILQFKDLSMNIEKYQLLVLTDNKKQQSIILDKNPYFYEELKNKLGEQANNSMNQIQEQRV